VIHLLYLLILQQQSKPGYLDAEINRKVDYKLQQDALINYLYLQRDQQFSEKQPEEKACNQPEEKACNNS
jgi:hypothetical protein